MVKKILAVMVAAVLVATSTAITLAAQLPESKYKMWLDWAAESYGLVIGGQVADYYGGLAEIQRLGALPAFRERYACRWWVSVVQIVAIIREHVLIHDVAPATISHDEMDMQVRRILEQEKNMPNDIIQKQIIFASICCETPGF